MNKIVDFDEEADPCEICGEPWELVRPGKSQPTCNCHLICPHCKEEFDYFSEFDPHPIYPKWNGFFCYNCGPIPESEPRS